MFIHSFALINSVDHLDPLPASKVSARRSMLGSDPAKSTHSRWSESAVAVELVTLTRLFKRLMRSRSRNLHQAHATNTAAKATSEHWQSTIASVRHVTPVDAQLHKSSSLACVHGSDRVPAMLRKAQAVRRLSPVQVGSFTSPIKVAARPRVHADPIDPQRVVISGSFAEVCATLDRLVDTQEADSASH